MKRKRFEELVVKVIESFPSEIREKIINLEIVIEDFPSRDTLSSLGLNQSVPLLGLYQGVPLTCRGHYYGNVLPDKIIIFQKAVETICQGKNDMEVERLVEQVIKHEVGHYFGLSESQLRKKT